MPSDDVQGTIPGWVDPAATVFDPSSLAGGAPALGIRGSQPTSMDSEGIISTLRTLGLETSPTRTSLIDEGQRAATARQNASPQALVSQLRDQIGQVRQSLQQQFQQAGTALGFAGGGQTARAQSRVLAQGGNQLQNLFAQGIAPGATALTQFLSNVTPLLSTQLRQPVSVQNAPDFSGLSGLIQGIGTLTRQNPQTGMSPFASLFSSSSFTPPSQIPIAEGGTAFEKLF